MSVILDMDKVENNLRRDGLPYDVERAVFTLIRHIATGGRLGEYSMRALGYVLSVANQKGARAPEVF